MTQTGNKQSGHIAFDRLVDLVEGRLSATEQAAAHEHITVCDRCTAELAPLDRMIGLMRSDAGEDAPSYVVARAVRLLRPIETPGVSPLRRVLAALQFDSVQRPLAFGVRSTQTGPRQLLFAADDRDIDLRVTAQGALWSVGGQVLGPCEGGQVELQGPSGPLQASLDELCGFMLPPVPSGSYSLILRLDDVEVELPRLDLEG